MEDGIIEQPIQIAYWVVSLSAIETSLGSGSCKQRFGP